MKTTFTNKFLNQVSTVRLKSIRKKIEKVILEVENADSLSQIKNLKKLKGETRYFRIRIGDYRIGLYFENEIIEFIPTIHYKWSNSFSVGIIPSNISTQSCGLLMK